MLTRARMYGALGGVVALSASMFTMVAPASGQADVAEPDDEAADTSVGASATGEYEACTENFGLGKVAEIVVEVNGQVPTPPLTFPEDVTVVATWDAESGTETCLPEPVTPELWEDHTFWGDVLDLPAPVGNFVFLPYDDQFEMCESTYTLTLVEAPPGYTIKVSVAIVPPPEITLYCNGSSFEYVMEQAAPLMTAPQLTALENFADAESYPVEGCNADGSGTPSADLAGAAAALVDALDPGLLALYEDDAEGETPCDNVDLALEMFYLQLVYDAEVGRQAIFQLTTPVPATPVDPPVASPVVVPPPFTG